MPVILMPGSYRCAVLRVVMDRGGKATGNERFAGPRGFRVSPSTSEVRQRFMVVMPEPTSMIASSVRPE